MLLFYDSKSVLYSDNNQSYLLETSTSTWLLGRVIQSMKFKVELTKLHCYLVPAKCSLIMIVFTLQPIYSKNKAEHAVQSYAAGIVGQGPDARGPYSISR